ncbi:hypothetical protein HGM15179_016984 [Zosterops borbonicus]|uniref:Uncharacterized protein n=1 Tax=Zosterops borbonicus TaxID=364589 RepID=A0A8K1G1S4_9PASS|nr:hypothetical protein HGM15179_016984 [Zosterops borbonicus]
MEEGRQVLHLERKNPRHQQRLGVTCWSSSEEKELGVLMDNRLSIAKSHAAKKAYGSVLVAKKANGILRYIGKTIPS